jgi:peptidoglycan/xylan/chitin deacetylase (PgdA/CDA1 family)
MNDLGRLVRTVSRVARTHYPAFVFGLPLGRDEIPVFTYHDVTAEEFAQDLDFLYANGYRTLSLDEYLRARERGKRPGRSVLLTFDDARKSFWTVALPLLETFGARAVLFAPTWWMRASARRPDDLFMSWEELKACAASGSVDVQSHAHRHALVAISPHLVAFASPDTLARFDIYDWPMRSIDGRDELGRPALGTPVYRAAPLLSAEHRYLECGDLTRECVAFVERCGGEEFFSRPGWQRHLHEFHRRCSRGRTGSYMRPEHFRLLLASEFELSRAEFRRHLGYEPHCIAYPWMLGSSLSLELARASGFKAAFGVALDYGAERRRAALPIPVFARVKCDWLRCLPGERRAGVLGMVGRKLFGLNKLHNLAH